MCLALKSRATRHNDDASGGREKSVDKRFVERQDASSRDAWLPAASVDALRQCIARYLDGQRNATDEIQPLASSFATCAREQGQAPERLLIAIRALWGQLGLSQGDRLHVESLYDQLVRQAIESYYAH
jgi:hypothetical protein